MYSIISVATTNCKCNFLLFCCLFWNHFDRDLERGFCARAFYRKGFLSEKWLALIQLFTPKVLLERQHVENRKIKKIFAIPFLLRPSGALWRQTNQSGILIRCVIASGL